MNRCLDIYGLNAGLTDDPNTWGRQKFGFFLELSHVLLDGMTDLVPCALLPATRLAR